ncbi:MAG: sporulation protein YqfD [Clostridia bacterium]|nr:sporulation protein YqfD [Clostridia bacterium]
MFDFVNNICGFLEIEIKGEQNEKLLNTAHKKRINLWHLRFNKNTVFARLKPKDFKKLRSIRNKQKIIIKKKRGLVFGLKKALARKGIIIGVVLFILIIEASSMFVLGINVTSNRKIDEGAVINTLSQLGVKEGALRKNIDTNYVAQKLMLTVPDANWAAVNIEGCKVTVNLNIKKPVKKERKPSNLIAKADGIITKIDVQSGETIKSVGDKVKKGEIIVSGISRDFDTVVIEPSKGVILAKTKYKISKSGNYTFEKYFTSGKKERKVLEFFGIKIPLYLGAVKAPYRSVKSKKQLSLMDKKLPVNIICKTFYMKEKRTVTLSEELLIKSLKKQAEQEIKSRNFISSEIKKEKIIKNKKSLTVVLTVSAIENIAKEKQIEK